MKLKRCVLVMVGCAVVMTAIPYTLSKSTAAERSEMKTEEQYTENAEDLIKASMFRNPIQNLNKAKKILLLLDDCGDKYARLGRVEMGLFEYNGFDVYRQAAAGYFYKSYEAYKSESKFYDAGVSLTAYLGAQAASPDSQKYNDIVEACLATAEYKDLADSMPVADSNRLFIKLLELYKYQEYSYSNSHGIYENLNKVKMDILTEKERMSYLITKAKLTVETLANTDKDDYNSGMKAIRYRDAWDSVIEGLIYFKDKDIYEYYRGLDALTDLALRAPNLKNAERGNAVNRADYLTQLQTLCPDIHGLDGRFSDYRLEETVLTNVSDILEYAINALFNRPGAAAIADTVSESVYPRLYFETLYLNFRIHNMLGWVEANDTISGSKGAAEAALLKCVEIKQIFEDAKNSDCLQNSFLYEVVRNRDLSSLEDKVARMT